MAHTSSRGSQSNAQSNSTADADLAALIEQCSKDIRCGLSRAHYLCKLMHAPYRFGTLEQIDRETVDWLMLSVNQLLDHYRAAAKTFPIVDRLVNAVADRTCAHEEALEFAHEVQMAFVCQHSSSELLEMADTVVSQWQSIRDFLLQRKCPDLNELLNRIKVEWAKAIESQTRRTKLPNGYTAKQPDASGFVVAKTLREQRGQKKLTTNDLMRLELFENPDSKGWSVTEWQNRVKRSRGSIAGSDVWKELEAARKLGKSDRRRRTKSR